MSLATPEATAALLALMAEIRDDARNYHKASLQRLDEIVAIQVKHLNGNAQPDTRRGGTKPAGDFGGGAGTFPNYGRSKGQPIAGANMAELEYYAAGALKTLADPAKSRWHDKERDLLANIKAEIARQSGGAANAGGGNGQPPDEFAPGDDDIPFVSCAGIR